jgi:hypothetical protein
MLTAAQYQICVNDGAFAFVTHAYFPHQKNRLARLCNTHNIGLHITDNKLLDNIDPKYIFTLDDGILICDDTRCQFYPKSFVVSVSSTITLTQIEGAHILCVPIPSDNVVDFSVAQYSDSYEETFFQTQLRGYLELLCTSYKRKTKNIILLVLPVLYHEKEFGCIRQWIDNVLQHH